MERALEPPVISDELVEHGPEHLMPPTGRSPQMEVGTPPRRIEQQETEPIVSADSQLTSFNIAPRLEIHLEPEISALHTTSDIIDNSLLTVPNVDVNPKLMTVNNTHNSITTAKPNLTASQMGLTQIEILNASLPTFNINRNRPVEQISAPNNELTQAEFGPNISPQYNPNFSQIAPALLPNIACQNPIAPQLPIVKTTSSHNSANGNNSYWSLNSVPRTDINSLNLPSYNGKDSMRFKTYSEISNLRSKIRTRPI